MLFLLFPLFAYAQPDSSKLIIRFNGGYADTGSSNGVASLGAFESNIRDWNVGLTVGFLFGKRWEAGIGFEYLKQKGTSTSTIFFPNHWTAIVGKAYLAGHWRMSNRLYFNPMLSLGIGKVKSGSEVLNFLGFESDFSYDYFAINLAPAFSFYLNPHFALNLETGSFSFATTDWEWDNKQWLAHINPAYWKLGIIVMF